MKPSQYWRGVLLLNALACAASQAAPPAPTPAPPQPGPQSVSASASAPAPVPVTVRPAADDELDTARGGSGVTTIDTRLAGEVSGNSATNVQTGWNVIDGGAFANMTGIPIVVQNSGANVLIQNATVIQLQLH